MCGQFDCEGPEAESVVGRNRPSTVAGGREDEKNIITTLCRDTLVILEGKTTIVTGAGWGIGKAIAVRFAREGARLTLVDINPSALAEVGAESRKHGAKILCVERDASDPACMDEFVAGDCRSLRRRRHPGKQCCLSRVQTFFGDHARGVAANARRECCRLLHTDAESRTPHGQQRRRERHPYFLSTWLCRCPKPFPPIAHRRVL